LPRSTGEIIGIFYYRVVVDAEMNAQGILFYAAAGAKILKSKMINFYRAGFAAATSYYEKV